MHRTGLNDEGLRSGSPRFIHRIHCDILARRTDPGIPRTNATIRFSERTRERVSAEGTRPQEGNGTS
jgi:hypothetical protein